MEWKRDKVQPGSKNAFFSDFCFRLKQQLSKMKNISTPPGINSSVSSIALFAVCIMPSKYIYLISPRSSDGFKQKQEFDENYIEIMFVFLCMGIVYTEIHNLMEVIDEILAENTFI